MSLSFFILYKSKENLVDVRFHSVHRINTVINFTISGTTGVLVMLQYDSSISSNLFPNTSITHHERNYSVQYAVFFSLPTQFNSITRSIEPGHMFHLRYTCTRTKDFVNFYPTFRRPRYLTTFIQRGDLLRIYVLKM